MVEILDVEGQIYYYCVLPVFLWVGGKYYYCVLPVFIRVCGHIFFVWKANIDVVPRRGDLI